MLAKLTATQAATLIAARGTSDYNRKDVKRRVFAEAKATHGIPASTKLRVELDEVDSPMYLVLRDKATDQPLTSNAVGTTATPVATPAAVNQAVDQATDKVADAAPAPTPAGFRFISVKAADIFVSVDSDEVVVRIPA